MYSCEKLWLETKCRVKEMGKKVKKGEVMSEVKMFIQNVHNFRDEMFVGW